MSKETDKQEIEDAKVEELAIQLLLKGFAEGYNQTAGMNRCWSYAEAFIKAKPAPEAVSTTDEIDPDVEQVISVLIEALLQSSMTNPIRLRDYVYLLKNNKFHTFTSDKIDQLVAVMNGRGLYPRIH